MNVFAYFKVYRRFHFWNIRFCAALVRGSFSC